MKQPRITKLYLENFQAISGPVEIEFGELTFLYGPNSAGKSAIFDAIGCFKDWLLDGFEENTDNPWNQARKRGKDESSTDVMLAIGLEIQVDQSQVDSVMGAYDEPPSDYSPFSVDNSMFQFLRNGARIDIRLVFGGAQDSVIELRINDEEPLLAIDNYILDANFFDVLKPYLPSEYVAKTQKPIPDDHPLTQFRQSKSKFNLKRKKWDDKEYFGKWSELHEALFSLATGYGWPRSLTPEINATECGCRINIDHPLGKSLLWPQNQNTSLEDRYVKEILDGAATFRGIGWAPSPSDNSRRVMFEPPEFRLNGPHLGQTEKSLAEVFHLTSDAPEIFESSPKKLRQEGDEFAKKISDIFYFISELFRLALHTSHVAGSRSIIDSTEPVHIHPGACTADYPRDFFPEYPRGEHLKNFTNPLNHMGKEGLSYRGYENAISRYADRIADLEEPEEESENGWHQDANGMLVPPNEYEDFPNYALKKLLPSLSRYRIQRFPYIIYQHWANTLEYDHLAGSALVYFKVYDKTLDKTLSFKNLGSGLSFVFPILVSLSESDISFIEQPELHLHPRAQAEIGDLLIAAKNKDNFSVIESHSEQIIMRVSSRIRETTNAKSRASSNIEELRQELDISAEDVNIYYFDPSPEAGGGTQITRIHFTPDGSLVDDWPEGFFEKDDMNSFSRLQLFSGNVDLEKARENWPWIREFEDMPDIVNWLSCASIVTIIEGMYSVVFPLYASKIAEKLIVEKLLDPFREEFGTAAKYEHGYHETTRKYVTGNNRPPSFGDFTQFLYEVERPHRSSESKIISDFRQFLRTRPWNGKHLLRDKTFINQLDRLRRLRNKGAHIGNSGLNEALEIQSILVVDGQPGPLFEAFGYDFNIQNASR